MIEDLNQTNTDIQDQSDNEIDFKKLLNILLRRRVLIISFSLIASFASVGFSLFQKNIWKGEFQIVVEKKENNINPLEGNAYNLLTQQFDDYKTQKSILTSPLVLLPVYEYVINEYRNEGINVKNLTYKNWIKEKLRVEFVKGTKVLTVAYQDSDKKIITDSLNLISKQFQDYSKRDREKELVASINYLENQLAKFKKSSKTALKKFNKFSIENGLGDIDGFVELDSEASILPKAESSISDKILKNLKSTDTFRVDKIQAGQRYQKQFALLESYEARYIDLASKLKPNSTTLLSLKAKIDNLKSSLKRPNEILLEFRNLKKIASREESTLKDIELNLEKLRLEQKRKEEPWEIISKTSINDIRVWPKRKLIVGLTFLASIFMSTLLALFLEQRKKHIYEIKDFKKYIPFKYLTTLFKKDIKYNSKIIENLLENKKIDQVAFLHINNDFISTNEKTPFYKFEEKKLNIFSIKDIELLEKYTEIILIASPGIINPKNILLFFEYATSLKTKIGGWIFLNIDDDLQI